MTKPRAALTFALLTGVIPSAWAQGHPGTPFGARDPVVCASRKAPEKGAPTAAQANAYFRCDNELVNGFLYLVAEIKLEVAPGARAFIILTDTTGIIDPKRHVLTGTWRPPTLGSSRPAPPGL